MTDLENKVDMYKSFLVSQIDFYDELSENGTLSPTLQTAMASKAESFYLAYKKFNEIFGGIKQ